MAIWHEEYELYRKYIHNISRFYKQSAHVQAYLELGLSLGATVIFLTFAIRPTVITITEKLKEMNDKQRVVVQLNQKLDSLSIAESILREKSATLALLEEAIPHGSSPEEYVIQIDSLAQISGVTLESMTIEETPILGTRAANLDFEETTLSAERIEWFPFTLAVTGSFEELTSLMTSIENLRRPIQLNNSRVEETVSGDLRLTVTGQIPYYINE